MTPIQALARRERRIDALIDRIESGEQMTQDDWRRLDALNTLDLLSVSEGAAREVLEREEKADGVIVDGTESKSPA